MNEGIRTLVYPVKMLERTSTFRRQLLGVDPDVEQPYYIAFRLGDKGIGLGPMDVSPVL